MHRKCCRAGESWLLFARQQTCSEQAHQVAISGMSFASLVQHQDSDLPSRLPVLVAECMCWLRAVACSNKTSHSAAKLCKCRKWVCKQQDSRLTWKYSCPCIGWDRSSCCWLFVCWHRWLILEPGKPSAAKCQGCSEHSAASRRRGMPFVFCLAFQLAFCDALCIA